MVARYSPPYEKISLVDRHFSHEFSQRALQAFKSMTETEYVFRVIFWLPPFLCFSGAAARDSVLGQSAPFL